jgi:pimeloyl-ACP methyl ester carboxylesterase
MSAGGPIAVVFAATHPYRVRSLALVSTGLDLWSRTDPKLAIVREQYALLRREGPGAAFDRRPTDAEISLDALWERDEAIWDGILPAWEARQRALLREASYIPRDERVRRYAAELRDMMSGLDVDLRNIASRVAAPTIVFHGGADRIIPMESAQELAVGIPNARWKCFVGEGHQMLFTNQHVRRAVIRFATHH